MKRSKTPTINDVATQLNLGVAHRMARHGKSFYHSVQRVDEDPDAHLKKLQEILLSGEYRTSEYVHEIVNDNGKTREISKLPYYPDRIVHWAIMLQTEPLFRQKFTRDTHAAIAGRGTHTALRQTRGYLISDPEGTKYCLKLDVRKYFPHIQHGTLRDMISAMVRNKPLLDLFFEIIESVPPERGVPIGNYLSQFFANLYLTEFDHWIKEQMGVKYYIRYMDDIVLLGDTAEHLHQLFREIEWYLASRLQLDIKPNWQIFEVESRGVDFVGYRMYHNRTLIRKKTFARMRKRCATIYYHAKIYGELTRSELSSLMSYNGIVRHCTPKVRIDLYRRYIEPTVLALDINITKNMGTHTMIRTYTTGEMPENPVLHEKYVFLISDIRQEPPDPESPETVIWSYVIDEQLTYPEYIARMSAEAEARQNANNAAILELDEDICTLYDIVEGGA